MYAAYLIRRFLVFRKRGESWPRGRAGKSKGSIGPRIECIEPLDSKRAIVSRIVIRFMIVLLQILKSASGNIYRVTSKKATVLHVRVLFVRTQFTFRQRRLSLGRCEHKLDAPCPLHTDHLLPTCNYGRFHRTLKSVARSWQYVAVHVQRVDRDRRSQILYPDVGELPQNLRLR